MPSKQFFTGLLFVSSLATALSSAVAQTEFDPTKYITSRDKIGGEATVNPAQTYRTKWALVIGVDYAEGEGYTGTKTREIPKLSNAKRDAEALSEKLIQKYGYLRENVIVLLETKATRDQISRALERLHSADVGENDSVLVFFAGHGAKQDDVDGNVVIYPHDVELHDGRATSGMIFVRDELISKLNKSKARHKLVILDSCYSGEVFSQQLELQAKPEAGNGSDKSLFLQPGFQVIASCRGYQKASDGTGIHSPFALALLRALEEIPSNQKEPPRIWTGRLMSTLDEEFRVLPDGQRPSHRSLAGGQGEFTFFPDFDHAQFGDQSHGQLLSIAMLRATSPGVKGNWWFDEMPWFMPSVRGRILMQNQVQSRSNDHSASIQPTNLRRIAIKVRDRMREDAENLQNKTSDKSTVPSASNLAELKLLQLRQEHLTKLLMETDSATRLKTLESIETDLLKPEHAAILEAPDVHLLAVVQHAIGREQALTNYETAIHAYALPSQSDATTGSLYTALKALCHADFGDGLQTLGRDSDDCIEQYSLALNVVGPERPVAFEVYCLCRLSSAYLKDNRWEDANAQLRLAQTAVTAFDSQSHLAAFVQYSSAWSNLNQWHVADAEQSLRVSNRILMPLILEKASPESRQKEHDERLGERSEAFRQSTDFGGKVAYFNNLHGLAMTLRYRGKALQAAAQYRSVIAMIEDAIDQLRHASDESSTRTKTESSLFLRFINSQERLGDCNLLGEPSTRDLAEAADDYRRALSRVHRLPSTSQTNQRAQLLYKQSLAFSLPSPIQDVGLALEMCHQADQMLEDDGKKSTGLLLALRTLTTPMVEMLSRPANFRSMNEAETDETLTVDLRSAIHHLRDLAGASAHRDQLELMLFASRNLIEFGKEPSRLKRSEDVELLLSLNRLALNRRNTNSDHSIRLGSQAFLRQYYDSAFLASFSTTPGDAKRLLEIQHEATTGTRFGKLHVGITDGLANQPNPSHYLSDGLQPVLAVYQVDDVAYLICDCPRSQGNCIPLTDICSTDCLVTACNGIASNRMRLPTKIARQLDAFFAHPDNATCHCRLQFRDPLRKLGYSMQSETLANFDLTGKELANDQQSDLKLNSIGQFPFQLPENWTTLEVE